MMKKETLHRTIKLDHDVAYIAQELANRRELSKVLSELLRKEYGIITEHDILQNQINELERRKSEVDSNLKELKKVMMEKIDKENEELRIEKLNIELANINIDMKNEMNLITNKTVDDLNIDIEYFEGSALMVEISRKKNELRKEIENKFSIRKNEIIKELEAYSLMEIN